MPTELKISFTYTEDGEDTPGCAANVDIKYSNLNYCGVGQVRRQSPGRG